jgi:hypothetical protein
LRNDQRQNGGILLVSVEQISANNSILSCEITARDLKKVHRLHRIGHIL